MGRYNLIRPILLIVVAFATKMLVESVLLLAGAEAKFAEDTGYIAMIIAAFITYFRMRKASRK